MTNQVAAKYIYFYTDGKPTGLKKEFVDFVMSEKGQNLVSEVGHFPIQK